MKQQLLIRRTLPSFCRVRVTLASVFNVVLCILFCRLFRFFLATVLSDLIITVCLFDMLEFFLDLTDVMYNNASTDCLKTFVSEKNELFFYSGMSFLKLTGLKSCDGNIIDD